MYFRHNLWMFLLFDSSDTPPSKRVVAGSIPAGRAKFLKIGLS